MPNPGTFDYGDGIGSGRGVAIIFFVMVAAFYIGSWIKDSLDKRKRERERELKRQQEVSLRAWRADQMRNNNWTAALNSMNEDLIFFCASCRDHYSLRDRKLFQLDGFRLCEECYQRWMVASAGQ